MFGTCHWWAITPVHPWVRTIKRIQNKLKVFEHVPHITICTNSSIETEIPEFSGKFECTVKVTQTLTEAKEGTLWALEIPVSGFQRPDGESLHLALAYRWNKPFTQQEIVIVSKMCVSMQCFNCTFFEHQVWECNCAPDTWVRTI